METFLLVKRRLIWFSVRNRWYNLSILAWRQPWRLIYWLNCLGPTMQQWPLSPDTILSHVLNHIGCHDYHSWKAVWIGIFSFFFFFLRKMFLPPTLSIRKEKEISSSLPEEGCRVERPKGYKTLFHGQDRRKWLGMSFFSELYLTTTFHHPSSGITHLPSWDARFIHWNGDNHLFVSLQCYAIKKSLLLVKSWLIWYMVYWPEDSLVD